MTTTPCLSFQSTLEVSQIYFADLLSKSAKSLQNAGLCGANMKPLPKSATVCWCSFVTVALQGHNHNKRTS